MPFVGVFLTYPVVPGIWSENNLFKLDVFIAPFLYIGSDI